MMIDFEAAVAQLVGLGFSRETAEREARRQLVYESGPASLVRVSDPTPAPALSEKTIAISDRPILFPLELTLPWSALCSDNNRSTATIVQKGGRLTPLLCLTGPYREAKAKSRKIARDATAGAEPVAIPVRLEALVWVPDNRPHDVPNFAKCAHDAFSKVVYVDDKWLYESRWIRAGVDVDRPRAEITITPICTADA